jgi:hypothetical protein
MIQNPQELKVTKYDIGKRALKIKIPSKLNDDLNPQSTLRMQLPSIDSSAALKHRSTKLSTEPGSSYTP